MYHFLDFYWNGYLDESETKGYKVFLNQITLDGLKHFKSGTFCYAKTAFKN